MISVRLASTLATTALAISTALLSAPAAFAAQGEIGCAEVEVLVVRGTLEFYPSSLGLDGSTDVNEPTGVYGLLKKELTQTAPGLTTTTDGSKPIQVVRADIQYPASVPDPWYTNGKPFLSFATSVRAGTKKLIDTIAAESVGCPDKRFVLLGYSQGAIVVANAISPMAKRLFYYPQQGDVDIAPALASKIAAVGMFADAGFNAANGRSEHDTGYLNWPNFAVGTFDDLGRGMNDGTFADGAYGQLPRAADALISHKGKVRNYCIFDDPICNSRSGGVGEHLNYMGDIPAHRNLAMFVVQQLRNQVEKTIPATCTVTYHTTDQSKLGTTFPANLGLKVTVNDRGVPGNQTSLTGLSYTLSLSPAAANTVRSILGGNGTVQSALLQQPFIATGASGALSQTWSPITYSPTAITANTAWSVGFGATAAPTWTVPATGRLDLSIGSPALVLGGPNAAARSVCTPTEPRQAAFGRIVTGY